MAGDRSSRHTRRGEPRREGREAEYRGAPTLRRRPCGALGQLCLGGRRFLDADVGGAAPSSGGGGGIRAALEEVDNI